MPEESQVPKQSPEERRRALSEALEAELSNDARFGSGLARDMNDTDRLRVQIAGAARPATAPPDPPELLRAAHPAATGTETPGDTEHWTEAVARLLQAEKRPQPPQAASAPQKNAVVPPTAPALADAERFLRELEEQPREADPASDDDSAPASEVSF